MKIRYINTEKFKNKKYKLFAFACILSGVLTMSGCTTSNLNNDVDISNQQIDESKEYSAQLIFNNLEHIKERDTIGIYGKNGEIYGGFFISQGEENHEVITPVQDYIISSEIIGAIEVHVDENSETCIYVDYLTKTINLETEKNLHKNSK